MDTEDTLDGTTEEYTKKAKQWSRRAAQKADENLSVETKYFLNRRYRAIAAVFLILALSGVYVAYTAHTTTETVAEERVISTWSTSTEFQHGVTVQRDAIVFEEGVKLEDRTIYFRSLSPVLDASYVVRHGGDSPEPASARAELSLVLRSIGDGGTEYWRESETLVSADDPSLQPGEALVANFSVNVTKSVSRLNQIEQNLSASPGSTQILVLAETAIEGEVTGGEYTDTRSETLRIEPSSGTYSVSTQTGGQRTERMTQTVRREIQPSFLSAYGSVIFALLALFGFSTTVWARKEGVFDIQPEEEEKINYERQRESLDEWISRGEVSGDQGDTEVTLETLQGLVDVAIDSNRRVTEVDDGSYVVLLDDVRYIFDPEFDGGDGDGGLPTDRDDLKEMSHRELQNIAQQVGIKANQSNEDLLNQIEEELEL